MSVAVASRDELKSEEVSVERAAELIEHMSEDRQEIQTSNTSIYVGDLPHYGASILIIPSLGPSVLLFSD